MLDRIVTSDCPDTDDCPHREHRAMVRYRLPVETLNRNALAKAFRVQEGTALSICATGVGLLLPHSIAVGTKVFLQLWSGAPGTRRGWNWSPR